MKRKIFLLGSAAVLALSFTSCKTSAIKTETRTLTSAHTPIVLEPKFVDYEVNLKTKATATVEGKVKKDETAEMYLNKAISQAVTNSGADFLFEPVYEIEGRRKRIKVTVSGYPAKYSNMRKVDMKDSLEAKFYQNQQLIKELGFESIKENKKKKGFLFF